jgi:hypothetical protein
VPCCFLCNTIKRDMELSELSTHLSKMLKGIGGLAEQNSRLAPRSDLSEPRRPIRPASTPGVCP